MILDTSALLAILLREEEAEDFARLIAKAKVVRLSVASYLEAAIFVERNGGAVQKAMLDQFLDEFAIQLEPVTVDQIRLAREGFRMFGKGIHPAGLNYGDCFTYALARSLREPVLFKGGDFRKTDLTAADLESSPMDCRD